MRGKVIFLKPLNEGGPKAWTFRIPSKTTRRFDDRTHIGFLYQGFLQSSVFIITHQFLDKTGKDWGFYNDHRF